MGYVTYGSGAKVQWEDEETEKEEDDSDNDEEELPCANQAIVFMLKGLNQNFRLPIAYEFIRSINAYQRADLVMATIKRITKCGKRIANLTFDGPPANHTMCEILGANFFLKSSRRTGFIGMIINARSMQLIYDEYIQNGLISSLPTYSMSQDHLEAFFSHIRARQGANDNPKVIEFKAAWRKLLCGNLELIQSRYSNVTLLDESSLHR